MIIVNNTNRHYKIWKGCRIGRMFVPEANDICTVETALDKEAVDKQTHDKLEKAKVHVPDEHASDVNKILSEHRDIFAEKYTDLGQTDIVRMSINTGVQPPIKLRGYRAPIHQQQNHI